MAEVGSFAWREAFAGPAGNRLQCCDGLFARRAGPERDLRFAAPLAALPARRQRGRRAAASPAYRRPAAFRRAVPDPAYTSILPSLYQTMPALVISSRSPV